MAWPIDNASRRHSQLLPGCAVAIGIEGRMSWRSAFGGVGKKVSLSSPAVPSGSEKVSPVLGF